MDGKPIQFIKTNPDHTMNLLSDELEDFLLSPNIKDKPVCIISVVGGFRQGKSFLLDYFLRYLEATGKPGWEGEPDEPLQGFSWRGGAERETTGIWLWSKPFILKDANGHDIVILLLDTQGTFDTKSTVRENVTIFGLSTLISSIEVYNIQKQISEDTLQHLQLFTEYGKLVAEGTLGADSQYKPFQTLRFLVRDWQNPNDYAYGHDGGKELLNFSLETDEEQHEDLKSVREHIRESFETVDAYLLPHPGFEVVENQDFDGRSSLLRDIFKDNLYKFIEYTFSPKNLICKKVNGENITCHELLAYIRVYMEMFCNDELPEPKTALQATAEAIHVNAVQKSLNYYEQKMDAFCQNTYQLPETLKQKHEDLFHESVDLYNHSKKIGSKSESEKYLKDLKSRMNMMFSRYEEMNDKNFSLSTLRTPIFLLTALVCFYILSAGITDAIFTFLGFSFLLTPLDISFYFTFFLLLGYAFIKASGFNHPLVSSAMRQIDILANHIWQNGLEGIAKNVRNTVVRKTQNVIMQQQ